MLQLQAAKPRLSAFDFHAWTKTLPVPYQRLSKRGQEAAALLFSEMVRAQDGPASGQTAITVEAVAVVEPYNLCGVRRLAWGRP